MAQGGVAIGQEQQQHADDAIDWANANNALVVNAAKGSDPQASVPGYQGTDTALSDYYINQSAASLEADGVSAVVVSPEPTTEYVWQQSTTPLLRFSEQDPLLVNSWAIQDNTAVVEGELVMRASECTDGAIDTPETTIEHCTAWSVPEESFCDSELEVTVEVNPRIYQAIVAVENDAGRPAGTTTLGGSIPLNDAGLVVDYGMGTNGELIGWIRVVDGMDVPPGFDCSSVTDVTVDVDGTFISVDTAVCSGGRWFGEVLYRSGPSAGGTITYTVEAGAAPVYTDSWTDGCPGLMEKCEAQGPPSCIEGAEERLVTANTGELYPVIRDCWRYRTPLLCAATSMTDSGYCEELVDRGCSPISSDCPGDGTCEHTYDCPLDGWSEPVENCGDTTFGLSGIEFDTSVEPSGDFGMAAANLQAMEEAVLDLDSDGVSCTESPPGSGEFDCVGELLIFNGEPKQCKKTVLGFSNCCSRSGWGLGWADSCNTEEQELRLARQQGQCAYVGTYCSDDSIFGCLAKKETHCCFKSKLSRIIHEQGRPQLAIGWGTATAPECDGFSAAQLASLDFGLIDFSEYFAEAYENISGSPDNATMESIIDAYITTLSGSSCSQFDPNYPDC